ncbi:MAG TPA: thioredoxin family protein [Mariniphaga sp.]|nr:thioredoxin family protein [Mariniphaga sp.]
MEIKILGTGCPKCKSLENAAREAISELGINATITKEEDIMKIMGYGVMRTPGIVVDEKVISSGSLLTTEEIKQLLIK